MPSDPTDGTSRQRLAPAMTRRTVPFLLLATLLAPASAPQSVVIVGPGVRASANHTGGDRNEPWVAASPTNPEFLVGVSQIGPTGSPLRCTTLLSRTGGDSWREITLPGQEDGCFDPLVIFARSGRLIVMHTLVRRGDSAPTIRIWSSEDEARTWNPPVDLDTPLAPDHPRMVIDESGGPHDGRLYVVWNEARDTLVRDRFHLFMNHSDDGGETFSSARIVMHAGGGKLVAIDPAVLSDGTLLVHYFQYRPGTPAAGERKPVFVVRSPDGGATFGAPEPVVEVGPSVWPHLRREFVFAYSVPVVVADRSPGSPFRDRLYVVWDEIREGASQIYLASSADGGRTWSDPVRVNDNAPEPGDDPPDFRMTPVAAVDALGTVGVAWYDRRDDPGRRCWHQYFAASVDGGASFLPNRRVSTRASCPEPNLPPDVVVANIASYRDPTDRGVDDLAVLPQGAERDRLERDLALDEVVARAYEDHTPGGRIGFDRGRNQWPGHYTGMASSAPGIFHPLWADRRGSGQQLFTARVTLGSGADLAPPTTVEADLTDSLALLVDTTTFDEAAGVAYLEIRLANTSDRTVYAPLTVTLTERGAPARLDSGDPLALPQSWNLSEQLGDPQRLEPGRLSGARKVSLRVTPESGLDIRFGFSIRGRLES